MLNSKIIRKLRAPIKFQRKFNAFRHDRIRRKLQDYLVNAEYQCKSSLDESVNYIWMFWAQGYDSMPDLVSKCIETVKKNSGNAQVILLTAENFEKYATLPEWIVDKFRSGIISPMYFSDALRFNLLKNHGGLWLDATDFVIDEITDEYFSDLCTVSSLSDEEHFFIAEGRWHTALFGGSKNHPLFQGMDGQEIETLMKRFHAHIQSFQKKSVFWDSNQRVEEIGIVLEGNVHIERIDENGITCLIDVLLPGDSLGEMFSISQAPLNTTFRIVKDAKILFFNARRVIESPVSDPLEIRFLQNLGRVLSKKSYSFSKRLADTVHRTTRQRLQDYLSKRK